LSVQAKSRAIGFSFYSPKVKSTLLGYEENDVSSLFIVYARQDRKALNSENSNSRFFLSLSRRRWWCKIQLSCARALAMLHHAQHVTPSKVGSCTVCSYYPSHRDHRTIPDPDSGQSKRPTLQKPSQILTSTDSLQV
jgi:hypothetical protein